jgi:eukaryotic-like serine/threonine-protein kinase
MTTTTGQSDAVRLLQERVAKFGLYAGTFGLLAFVFRVPADLSRFGWTRLLTLHYYVHLATALVPMAVWLVARRGAHSERFLRWAEGTGLVASCFGYACMGYGIEAAQAESPGAPRSAQFIVLLAMTLVTFARTIFVPSTARHTLLITIASAGGLLLLASPLGTTCPTDAFGNRALPYVGTMLGAAMWWSLITFLATLASGVIYGLRREADQAKEYGQYTLVEKIGEGGMGVVYRAHHRLLRRPTAVKLLPSDRAGAQAIARFEREVQLTAQLTHPNTVTVFDYGRTPDGIFYYAMEMLDGETLQDIIDVTGPMPPARALRVLEQVAGALVEAHDLGLIHRDIKPANIMLCAQGGLTDVAKVLDFGLAQDRSFGTPSNSISGGVLVGTPLYLAPETITDSLAANSPADVYAFGAVAFWLLAGEPVYVGGTIVEICTKHVHAAIPSLSSRAAGDIPPELDALVLACLAKDPAARPTARELVEQLDQCPIEAWDDADATRWWSEHREQLTHRRKRFLTKDDSLTLQVDLARR